VRFEVFAAVWLTVLFFWDMTLFLTRSFDPKILSQHISRIFSVQKNPRRKFIILAENLFFQEASTLKMKALH
jgi:hypothetical protein